MSLPPQEGDEKGVGAQGGSSHSAPPLDDLCGSEEDGKVEARNSEPTARGGRVLDANPRAFAKNAIAGREPLWVRR